MEALALQSPIEAVPAEAVAMSDVARAAAGDAGAFEAVYRTHLPRVHSLVRRMTAMISQNSPNQLEATERLLERVARTSTNEEFIASLKTDL